MLSWLRIVLAILTGIFPVIFGHKIEDLNPAYAISFGVLLGALALVEIRFDHQEADKAEAARQAAFKKIHAVELRLRSQRERGINIAGLMRDMIPFGIKIAKLEEYLGALKKEGKSKEEITKYLDSGLALIKSVIEQMLKATADEIRAYWEGKADSVRANLMIAHETSTCAPEELQRLKQITKFLGFGRDLDSYQYILELVAWGYSDPEVPPALALPVEDPSQPEGKRRLLPGAPLAFALDDDFVIQNTRKISELAKTVSPDLDTDVLKNLQDYFGSKRMQSFACLVLHMEKSKVAVLNVQSNETEIFGPENADKETMTKSIEHYRYCLEYLISSQQRLKQAAR